MRFKKEIINVGGSSIGIRFTIQELQAQNIEEGDYMDLTDAKLEKKKKVTK